MGTSRTAQCREIGDRPQQRYQATLLADAADDIQYCGHPEPRSFPPRALRGKNLDRRDSTRKMVSRGLAFFF